MDRIKFSTIAHHHHTFCSPISSAKANQLISLVALMPGHRVLDVGCGKAELLIRFIERYQVHGVGVDPNSALIHEARIRAADRIPPASLELLPISMQDYRAGPGSFDLALCIGSTHAYGDYRTTLRTLRQLIRPGGHVLIGEGYWKHDPDPAYLEVLGAQKEEYGDHRGNVVIGLEEGLVPLYSIASTEEEWDHYEGLYCCAVERYVYNHPDDPDGKELRERIQQWRDTYLRWGRTTLGFGLYLFQKE